MTILMGGLNMSNEDAARIIISFYRKYSKGYGCEQYDEAVSRAVAALYATKDTMTYDPNKKFSTEH